MIYGEVNPETKASLAVFEKKYNIGVEYVIGKSAEIATKWEAEQRGGLNLADAFIIGGGTSILSMKPKGAYGSLEPYLILPERKASFPLWYPCRLMARKGRLIRAATTCR